MKLSTRRNAALGGKRKEISDPRLEKLTVANWSMVKSEASEFS